MVLQRLYARGILHHNQNHIVLLGEMSDFIQLAMRKIAGNTHRRAKARAPAKSNDQSIPSLWTSSGLLSRTKFEVVLGQGLIAREHLHQVQIITFLDVQNLR